MHKFRDSVLSRFVVYSVLLFSGILFATSVSYADTLGLTTQGSSSTAIRNILAASKFTMPNVTGSVSSISVYFANTQANPNDLYQVAIYSDNNGVPGNLIANSAFGNVISNSWNTASLSTTLSPNATYWIAVNTNGYNYVAHNTSAAGSSRYIAQLFGTMPGAFGASTASSLQLSIYVTYSVVTSDPDVVPPTVTITSPVASATVAGTVSISADATDNVSVSGVRFFVDGVSVGNEDVAFPYSYDWNTTLYSEGNHTLTAVARDSSNNYSTSTEVAVSVSNETTPPDPGTIVLPTNFGQTLVASGLESPTAMAFAPDGRLFVLEQPGRIRIVKNGSLLPTPFATIPVYYFGEVGLLGIALDPSFDSNGYVYVYYTTNDGPREFNRISRFTADPQNPDTVLAGSEVYIIEDLGIQAANHDGGVLHFGLDGMLYVGVGDHGTPSNSQNLGVLAGKILRLNVSNYPNIIPADNPFNSVQGARPEIYAYGVRNPFTFNVDPVDGRININDVGGDQEEINRLVSGANYGWPNCTGGPCGNPQYTDPLFSYPKGALNGCAITGGTFYRGTQFPASYNGLYLFSDYCGNFIRIMEDGMVQTPWADGFSAPVDLQVADDGTLYVLEWVAGQVRRIEYLPNGTNRNPVSVISADVTTGPLPLTVNFSSAGSTDPDNDPLSYLWDFDDNSEFSTSSSPSHIYTIAGNHTAKLVVSDGRGGYATSTLVISAGNNTPVAEITSPSSGSTYRAGDTIYFSGIGTDAEDGVLAPESLTWKVNFHHDTHFHPVMGETSGISSGSFQIPTVGETSTNVWYRIHLTVRDSNNVTHEVYRDIFPQLGNITLLTSPAGLSLTLDGSPIQTPYTFSSVIGAERQIGAQASQTLNGEDYNFTSWSDGEVANHVVTASTTDLTYTANYTHVNYETIGLTTQGSNSTSARNLLAASRFVTPATGGQLHSMSVYFTNVPSAPNNQYQLAVYADNGGVPGSLVTSSQIGTATSNSWNTLPIIGTLNPNTTYWFTVNTNGTLYITFNPAPAGATRYRNETFGTMPTTFGTALAYPATLSIYASYLPN